MTYPTSRSHLSESYVYPGKLYCEYMVAGNVDNPPLITLLIIGDNTNARVTAAASPALPVIFCVLVTGL